MPSTHAQQLPGACGERGLGDLGKGLDHPHVLAGEPDLDLVLVLRLGSSAAHDAPLSLGCYCTGGARQTAPVHSVHRAVRSQVQDDWPWDHWALTT